MAIRFTNPEYLRAIGPYEDAPQEKPFIVFAGRSNSGKSSVINALCGGRYARVSGIPGSTGAIQLFTLPGVMFADFPGYGYAARAKRQRRDWLKQVKRFLQTAPLVCIVTIVDSRLGIGILDEQWLDFSTTAPAPSIILLNKMDKLNRREQNAAVSLINTQTTLTTFSFSATKKTGVQEVRKFITHCLSPPL